MNTVVTAVSDILTLFLYAVSLGISLAALICFIGFGLYSAWIMVTGIDPKEYLRGRTSKKRK